MSETKELSQPARRENAVFTDQFGRKWEAVVDVIARGTCSAINPKGFEDRLHVPQKYLKPNTQDRTILVDLERYLADLESSHAQYDQQLRDDALMLFGQAGPQMYETKAVALLKFTGEPPQPMEPVQAALAGNKYCLGLSDKMPEWAKPFFIKPEAPKKHFPDAEDYADFEEEADPEAMGGKRVPIKKTRTAEAA